MDNASMHLAVGQTAPMLPQTQTMAVFHAKAKTYNDWRKFYMNMNWVFTSAQRRRYSYYRHFSHSRLYSFLMAILCFKKFYLKYLEIPVTTGCTLCCRHCANLLQYYDRPRHGSVEQIIGSLTAILSSVDGVALLRILGGEPLLHPELCRILDFCLKEQKIKKIEVATNGTLLFSEDALASLADHVGAKPDVEVCISDYGQNSGKKDILVRQLEEAGIAYRVESNKWRAAGNISRRNHSADAMKKIFWECSKCVSLLNGELHICPRSSHGTDLHIVPKKQGEYVAVLEYGNDKKALRTAIYKLLDRKYVEACDYCDGDNAGLARPVEAGEQCSRAECLAYLREVRSQPQEPSQGER